MYTSVGVSEYSFTLSTDTMFVSSSLLIRTIQLSVVVTFVPKKQSMYVGLYVYFQNEQKSTFF